MKLFNPKPSIVEVNIPENGKYKVRVQWSLLCYPVVLDEIEGRFSNPSVDDKKRLMHYSTPNEVMKFWYKMLFNKKKWIEKVLAPYLANCMYYELTGEFANGYIEYKKN